MDSIPCKLNGPFVYNTEYVLGTLYRHLFIGKLSTWVRFGHPNPNSNSMAQVNLNLNLNMTKAQPKFYFCLSLCMWFMFGPTQVLLLVLCILVLFFFVSAFSNRITIFVNPFSLLYILLVSYRARL